MVEGGTIHERMARILSDITAIGKDQQCTEGFRFSFRGIDTVLNELHGLFALHSVYIMPEVIEHNYFEQTSAGGKTMFHQFLRVKFTFYAPDGTSVSAVGMGEALDHSDKAVNKCMSISLKYVLIQALLIPTKEIEDPDRHSPEAAKATRGARKEERRNTAPPAEPDAPPELAQRNSPAQQAALGESRVAEETKRVLYQTLQAFQDMKKKIGEGDYYRILGVNGFLKSNEITNILTARQVYKQMAEFAKDMARMAEEMPK